MLTLNRPYKSSSATSANTIERDPSVINAGRFKKENMAIYYVSGLVQVNRVFFNKKKPKA
jgi:hypothetical protein